MRIYSIHAPDTDHLASVIAEMRKLGRPTIEVVDCGDYYQALEGSHRLAAAQALGLTPELIIHEQGDPIDVDAYDWGQENVWPEESYTAGEIAGHLFSAWYSVPYSFDDEERE